MDRTDKETLLLVVVVRSAGQLREEDDSRPPLYTQKCQISTVLATIVPIRQFEDRIGHGA